MITIRTRLKRSEARRLLAAVPALVSGRTPDPTGLVRSLQLLAGQAALALIKDAFVTKSRGGTDGAGDRWEPLKPATVAHRRQGRGAGAPEILRDTGVLLNSLSPGVAGNVLDAKPGEIIVGSNVPYARFHHEGTDTIPARRLWPEPRRWPAPWWRDIAGEVRDGVVRLAVRLLGGS